MQPKIASLVLDLYSDEKGEIARKLPTELHTCKVAGLDIVTQLPNRDFALVMKTASGIQRRFPIHDLDNLKVSQAYFEATKDKLPAEAIAVATAKFAARLKHLEEDKYGEEHDMREVAEYNKVAYVDVTKIEIAVKKAFADKAWGLVIDGKNHFPLHDAELVKTAIARFPFSVTTLEPIQKFAYARSIAKRAEALDVAVPDNSLISNYTANVLNKVALAKGLAQRKEAARRAGMGTEVLDQLAEAVGIMDSIGGAEDAASVLYRQAKVATAEKQGKVLPIDQLISILSTFDKTAGITQTAYNHGLLDPFASCFSSTKSAGHDRSLFIDGVDLSHINPAKLTERFDDEFVREFLADPIGTYQALPIPVRQTVRDLATDGMGSSPTLGYGRKEDCGGGNVTSSGEPLDMLAPTYSNGRALEF